MILIILLFQKLMSVSWASTIVCKCVRIWMAHMLVIVKLDTHWIQMATHAEVLKYTQTSIISKQSFKTSYLFLEYIDINECETVDGDVCEQLCINSNGSFACGCRPNYVLTNDHITCLGIILASSLGPPSLSMLHTEKRGPPSFSMLHAFLRITLKSWEGLGTRLV